MQNEYIDLDRLAEDVVMLTTILAKLLQSRMLRGYAKSILSHEEQAWLAQRVEESGGTPCDTM